MNPRTIINNKKDIKSRLHASVQIIMYLESDRRQALEKIKLLEQKCEELANITSRQKEALYQLNHYCCDNCHEWVHEEAIEFCDACDATYCNDCLLDNKTSWKLLEEEDACTNCLSRLLVI